MTQTSAVRITEPDGRSRGRVRKSPSFRPQLTSSGDCHTVYVVEGVSSGAGRRHSQAAWGKRVATTTAQATTAGQGTSGIQRAAFASLVGTTIEWYDFYL